MHELSIAMSILEFAQEEADSRGTEIEAIHIRVGALSGVVTEALDSAFELAREGTPLSACRLVIEEAPVVIYCSKCGADRPVPSLLHLCCPVCDQPAMEFKQGRELEVTGLEVAA